MLPLFAAESQKKNKQISIGEVLCELIVHHGMIAPDELIRFPCISKHVNIEASKKLDEYRLTLRQFVYELCPASYCQVTYSQNRLETAVIEDTNIHDDAGSGPLNFFWYFYFKNDKDIKRKQFDFMKSERRTDYPPFFTKGYACLDFGTDITMTMIYDATKTTGLCWNRITKSAEDSWVTRFFVQCENRYLPTGYFARVLPKLYAKIMQKSASFVYEKSITFSQPPQPGKKFSQCCTGPAFTIDLVKTDILTKDDVTLLNTFLPNGKYQKWFDMPKKYGYFLLNMLACYGSPHALLNEIDDQVGKYKIKWEGVGNVQASRCTENINLLVKKNNTIITFTEYGIFQPLSPTAQATLNYLAQLKKEGVFVEKDWHNKTDLKKRVKRYEQAIKFLRHKRMTWTIQNRFLIRHDSLSNTISVFEAQKDLLKIIDQPVSPSIDPHSIKVYFDAETPLYQTPYTLRYEVYPSIEKDDDSESSDVLVESSDDE